MALAVARLLTWFVWDRTSEAAKPKQIHVWSHAYWNNEQQAICNSWNFMEETSETTSAYENDKR